jgi:hypothetical protein
MEPIKTLANLNDFHDLLLEPHVIVWPSLRWQELPKPFTIHVTGDIDCCVVRPIIGKIYIVISFAPEPTGHIHHPAAISSSTTRAS